MIPSTVLFLRQGRSFCHMECPLLAYRQAQNSRTGSVQDIVEKLWSRLGESLLEIFFFK